MSDTLQRYETKELIAEGGLGGVYIAHDTKLNRDVAIKRLHPVEGMNPDELFESLLAESRILSSLNSPNIVAVFDVNRDGNDSFVVMELLNGETLEETVARAPLVEKDIISVIEQSSEGLISAHSAGLIHSDLKPENFMLSWWPSGRFQLKLLDFGIAKVVNDTAGDEEQKQDSGGLMGSIFFMAPEQFRKQAIDVRTDLYSLGCVFYYALTAKRPFDGDNPAQVMAAHLQNKYTSLYDLRPDVDMRILDLVTALINKDPNARYQSAQDVFDIIQDIKRTPDNRRSVDSTVITQSGIAINIAQAPTTAVPVHQQQESAHQLPMESTLPLLSIMLLIIGIMVIGIIVAALAIF